jgi:hypothetical protein
MLNIGLLDALALEVNLFPILDFAENTRPRWFLDLVVQVHKLIDQLHHFGYQCTAGISGIVNTSRMKVVLNQFYNNLLNF